MICCVQEETKEEQETCIHKKCLLLLLFLFLKMKRERRDKNCCFFFSHWNFLGFEMKKRKWKKEEDEEKIEEVKKKKKNEDEILLLFLDLVWILLILLLHEEMKKKKKKKRGRGKMRTRIWIILQNRQQWFLQLQNLLFSECLFQKIQEEIGFAKYGNNSKRMKIDFLSHLFFSLVLLHKCEIIFFLLFFLIEFRSYLHFFLFLWSWHQISLFSFSFFDFFSSFSSIIKTQQNANNLWRQKLNSIVISQKCHA